MTRPKNTTRRAAGQAGFSLIEILVAVTILAILTGAAVPVTAKVLTYKARKATKQELELLAGATTDYIHDTLALPARLEDLLVDPGVDRWAGPYLPGVTTDEITQLPGYLVDAWSRAYTVAVVGDLFTITSLGDDATPGTERDLELTVDATPARRQETIERLQTINQAILKYNAVFQESAPLSTSWSTAFSQVVSAGYLPNSGEYQVDAWGYSFVPDPEGQTPVVKVGSVALGLGSGTPKKPKQPNGNAWGWGKNK